MWDTSSCCSFSRGGRRVLLTPRALLKDGKTKLWMQLQLKDLCPIITPAFRITWKSSTLSRVTEEKQEKERFANGNYDSTQFDRRENTIPPCTKSASEGLGNNIQHSEGIEVSSSDSHVNQADDLKIMDIELGDTDDRPSAIPFLAKDEKIKNDGKAKQTMVPASPSPFHRREAWIHAQDTNGMA
ncbi:hypothetical protein NDU88_004209 [Pleurodeles waltl]|uniref:Uncharacterized protein n=1 Tax=Pleurodeles waltl TaxID=8319 RepID=A0AAV7V2X9_PLEWA|nr:hypothetical protein NDU88_004209 [Pleurodeles waltl]